MKKNYLLTSLCYLLISITSQAEVVGGMVFLKVTSTQVIAVPPPNPLDPGSDSWQIVLNDTQVLKIDMDNEKITFTLGAPPVSTFEFTNAVFEFIGTNGVALTHDFTWYGVDSSTNIGNLANLDLQTTGVSNGYLRVDLSGVTFKKPFAELVLMVPETSSLGLYATTLSAIYLHRRIRRIKRKY